MANADAALRCHYVKSREFMFLKHPAICVKQIQTDLDVQKHFILGMPSRPVRCVVLQISLPISSALYKRNVFITDTSSLHRRSFRSSRSEVVPVIEI